MQSATAARRRTGPVLVGALVVLLGLAGYTLGRVGSAGAQTTPPPAESLTIDGRGYGHGIGMGQWGAYGYATVGRWSHERILAHYYGGTNLVRGTAGGWISVRLSNLDGRLPIVTQLSGRLVAYDGAGRRVAAGQKAVLAVPTPDGLVRLFAVPGCDAPWGTWRGLGAPVPGPVTLAADGVRADSPHTSQLIGTCEPGRTRRHHRGAVRALWADGTSRTVVIAPLEQYLRGVVPSEVPATWADAAGGAGAAAVRAQAVAARSYARAERRATWAATCDTQSCQVYGGAAFARYGQVGLTPVEDPRSDAAIAATSDQLLVWPNGDVVSAMFCSSTGGVTAGGPFPVVLDLGDLVPENPHSSWTVSRSAAEIAAAYPEIGQLVSATVTQRTGPGLWGGRAVEVQLVGTTGQLTTSGDDVRRRLGLRSTWFLLTVVPVPD